MRELQNPGCKIRSTFISLLAKIGCVYFLLCLIACATSNTSISPGSDPHFTIISHSDPGLKRFYRKVVVFGIDIYAVPKVEDQKLLHAANILAQYLDNDEDGKPDNPLVIQKMLENKAFMLMWKSERDIPMRIPKDRIGQDLGNDETIPVWHRNGQTGRFDASLEEVWHIITHAGYAHAYPTIFGEYTGTNLTNAMDLARGGHFETIPDPYPTSAWYSYDDPTCEYNCMATEYIYWAMTSILGAQANRQADIQQEWLLHTRALVKERDSSIFQLLTDPQYGFPTVLPDGSYRR